jgi:hypothetical protein
MLCDPLDVHGKLAGHRSYGKRRNPLGQFEQRHVVREAAVPLRMIYQLLDRVLGIANTDVEPAA